MHRVISEAIESIVTPSVAGEILRAAVELSATNELPHTPSEVHDFVEGPLRMALCHFLDEDSAEIVIGSLVHVTRMVGGAPTPLFTPVAHAPASELDAEINIDESGVIPRRPHETGERLKGDSAEVLRPRPPERQVFETGERLRRSDLEEHPEFMTPPAPAPDAATTTVFILSENERANRVVSLLREHVHVLHVSRISQVLRALEASPFLEAIVILDGEVVVGDSVGIADCLRGLGRPVFVAVWNHGGANEWAIEGVCARERWAYLPPAEGVHDVVGFVRTMASG